MSRFHADGGKRSTGTSKPFEAGESGFARRSGGEDVSLEVSGLGLTGDNERNRFDDIIGEAQEAVDLTHSRIAHSLRERCYHAVRSSELRSIISISNGDNVARRLEWRETEREEMREKERREREGE